MCRFRGKWVGPHTIKVVFELSSGLVAVVKMTRDSADTSVKFYSNEDVAQIVRKWPLTRSDLTRPDIDVQRAWNKLVSMMDAITMLGTAKAYTFCSSQDWIAA